MTPTAPGIVVVSWHQMDKFVVRRRGVFHWRVMWIAGSDGIERDAVPGQRFWRWRTAARVQAALHSTMMNAFWQAGAHPLQHDAIPVAPVGGCQAPAGANARRQRLDPPGGALCCDTLAVPARPA